MSGSGPWGSRKSERAEHKADTTMNSKPNIQQESQISNLFRQNSPAENTRCGLLPLKIITIEKIVSSQLPCW